MTVLDERIAAVRRLLPATEKVAFLNTGSYGPMTAAAGAAIATLAATEVRDGRLGSLDFERNRALRTAARERFARVLGCPPAEVAITSSTTAGMNFAVLGLNWREGDEVITTDQEHYGGVGALYVLEHRYGVRVRFARTAGGTADALSAIRAEMSDRTRAIVLSHVSWSTGIVLPIAEVAALAHSRGAVCIVDGAQSAGAIPLEVISTGVDAYAIPGQKWLCGPEGIGAVYIASARMGDFLPSFAGFEAFSSIDVFGSYGFSEEARRFDPSGNPYSPAVAGMVASLDVLLDEIGFDWALPRVLDNAARCRELLEEIDGVAILTSPGRHAGLLQLTLAGWDPLAATQELLQRGVSIRDLKHPVCLRASTGFDGLL